MRRKIPATELLIAFETASRHESFTRAAEELSLTQSAVCRQISSLEGFLGVLLFSRTKKRVVLSEAGQVYARQVRDHLRHIEHDTLSLMAHKGKGGVLELAVTPTFATRWLIPRLPALHTHHPDLTLDIATRADPFMFNETHFDAAIHCGSPIWPGASTAYLFGEDFIPVCAPKLLNGKKKLKPEALLDYPLLQQSSRPDAWHEWFHAVGYHGDTAYTMGAPRYELFSMLIEAAKAGLGIALVPRFFVIENELASGALISPYDKVVPTSNAYYFVVPESKADSHLILAFLTWISKEALAYRERYASLSGV